MITSIFRIVKTTFIKCILIFTLPVSAQYKGDDFKSALISKKAHLVYVYNDVTDFAKTTDQNEVRGLLVDLMEEFELFVRTKYGITLTHSFRRVDENNFESFLNMVRKSSGGTFGLSNTSITESRKSQFAFSPPYINNISVLITHNSTPTLTSLNKIEEEFKDKVAFSVPSSTYLDRLKWIQKNYFSEMEIKLLNSGIDVVAEVAENEKAFAIVDLLYYLEFYKKSYPIKRHKTGDEFGIIMPLDNDWKPILDEFFTEFISGSEYRKVISDHLGKSAIRLIGSGSF